MNQVCIISLQEDGDEYAKVFPLQVYHWVMQPYNPPEDGVSHYREAVPDDIMPFLETDRSGHAPTEIEVTCGSWDNDRALQLSMSDVNGYMNLSEAIAYCQSNNLTVEETYVGLCY